MPLGSPPVRLQASGCGQAGPGWNLLLFVFLSVPRTPGNGTWERGSRASRGWAGTLVGGSLQRDSSEGWMAVDSVPVLPPPSHALPWALQREHPGHRAWRPNSVKTAQASPLPPRSCESMALEVFPPPACSGQFLPLLPSMPSSLLPLSSTAPVPCPQPASPAPGEPPAPGDPLPALPHLQEARELLLQQHPQLSLLRLRPLLCVPA